MTDENAELRAAMRADALDALKKKRDEKAAECDSFVIQRERNLIFQNTLRDKHIAAEAVRDSLTELINKLESPAALEGDANAPPTPPAS